MKLQKKKNKGDRNNSVDANLSIKSVQQVCWKKWLGVFSLDIFLTYS